ncbi:MAG: alpha/beta hydrolase [Burkholderiales bacterium]|jgi:arylformamidase|nr:alpha/beta hydrolase [Burkholderiales bacterium]
MKLYRDFITQAEIDAQYDVEKSVPDFMVYARHYIDESKLARHRLRCELDVAYGPTRDEHVDVFPAAGVTRGAPVLIFIHGGYWRMLSSKEFSCVALGPVAAGIATLSVNYALAPKVSIDEIVRQCRAAVAWVWRNATQFGGDPDRIYLTGHSAGGHLTAMCLQTDWEGEYGLPADVIKGAMPISGLFDLRPLRWSLMQPALQLDDGVIRRCSPLFHVGPSKVPLSMTWGGDEPPEFARQSEDFFREWQRAGNAGEIWPQRGANHFTAIYGFEDPKSELCRRLFRMIGVRGAPGA